MKNKTVLITGIGGQDGTLLTKYLLEKGYKIYGVSSSLETPLVNFKKADVDENQISRITLNEVDDLVDQIDEVYNFAAQSSVGESWKDPVKTHEINFLYFIKLVEKFVGTSTKILQASSSEIFKPSKNKINEESEKGPINPYGFSKYFAFEYSKFLREHQNLKIYNAILFNHESSLRDERFLFQKIVKHVVDYKLGRRDILKLGNVEIVRDWGSAEEYVEIMHNVVSTDNPDDYIISTGIPKSIKDIVTIAFELIDIEIEWMGEGKNVEGIDVESNETLVKVNSDIFRPNDVDFSVGDPLKLYKNLKVRPIALIEDVIENMIQSKFKA